MSDGGWKFYNSNGALLVAQFDPIQYVGQSDEASVPGSPPQDAYLHFAYDTRLLYGVDGASALVENAFELPLEIDYSHTVKAGVGHVVPSVSVIAGGELTIDEDAAVTIIG